MLYFIFNLSRSSNQSILRRCPSGLVTYLTTSLKTWPTSLPCWLTSVSTIFRLQASLNHSLLYLGYDPAGNPPNYGKADKIVIENTNDIKEHDRDWNEIAEKVKSLSKKDTMPRGGKHDDIKDFDQ